MCEKFHIKLGQIIGARNPWFQRTMKFGIAFHTEKIWKSTKFDPCNLNIYQDVDVTNLDQNPLILSEGGHLGMS